MQFDPDRHHRRSIRLPWYDYASGGAYFVTIVTYGRACIFGQVVDGKMRRNAIGDVVHDTWHEIPDHSPHIVMDAFVVMPNHVHGVLVLTDRVGATHASPTPVPGQRLPVHGPKSGSVGAAIGSFKAATTKRVNALRRGQGDACVAPTHLSDLLPSPPEGPLWQRNYYEHIIRNEAALNRIRAYIIENPVRWSHDPENQDAITMRHPPG